MDAAALTLSAPPQRVADPAAPERSAFLSTKPASPGERRLAFAAILVSFLIFAAAAPFARQPLPQVPAFLPIYQSALVVSDLITALLLFGQFGILRWNALLVLAGGYLFSALMAIAHGLSFPGLFAPAGLFGSGGQTTAWIYFLWHGCFPLAVIAYATLAARDETRRDAGRALLAPLLLAIGVACLAACGLTYLAITGLEELPPLMLGDRDAPAKVYVAAASWAAALVALPFLWKRRPLTVLDLWLMVVMCAWIFDVALASVLNGGRYDLGWYAGRVYGFLAASFVLAVLLLENGRLYAELAAVRAAEQRRAQESHGRHAERLRILHEIDHAIVGEVPLRAIAGGLIQPLRALLGVSRAIVNVFDLEAGEVEWLAAAGRHRTHVGPGVRYSIRMMGDVDALKRGETQIIDTRSLPPGREVDALLASGVKVYMVVPMIASGSLIGALSFGGEEADFPDEKLGIAREIATQLAIAMRQAGLLERVRRHAEELESRVQERTVELQATNRELEAFSYSVSHDLRSPLRAIGGFTQILSEDYGPGLDDEGRRLLGVIRDSTIAMENLIEDLLKFARAGRAPIAASALDMGSLVGGVVADLAQAYPKARIELGPLPPANGDAALLKQVWTNLVANALKYSSRGAQPRVQIGGSAGGGECAYWVRDNGAGFDMRYGEKLFKVFQRLHRPEEFEGTGVGLAIVQRVVVRHGGRVWAEGKPGEGACFHFTLPAAAA